MFKNKNFTKILALLSLGVFSFFAVYSYATVGEGINQNPNSSSSSRPFETPRAIAKCFEVENRFASKTEKLDLNHATHAQKYQAIYSRVTDFKSTAASNGSDTSRLEKYLVEFKSRIDQFETNYQAFKSSKTETKNGACTRTEDDFRNSLENSRRKLASVDQDSKNIIAYIRNIIFPELKNLSNK